MTEPTPDQTPPPPGQATAALARLRERRAKMLRVRYAVLGAVMAFLWIGHKGEPAWIHAVRLLLVLLTITPVMSLTRRYYAARATRKQPHPNAALYWLVSVRVITVGVALGIGWLVSHLLAAHHSDSIRLIVVRGGLLALTIPLQIRFERRRQAAGIVRPLPVRSPRIIGAKLALVLVALGAEWLLGKVTPSADWIVAAGVFATVALLGPKAHRYLISPHRRLLQQQAQQQAQQQVTSQAAEPLPASD
jgi:hypothetical protein